MPSAFHLPAGLVLASLPFLALAQARPQPAPPAMAVPAELSLSQALALAQTTQGAYRNLALDEQAAALASRATRGLYTPQVGAAADLRYNAIIPTNILPNIVNPASPERLALKFGTKYQASAGLTLSQRLYDASALAQRRVDAVTEQLAANATLRGRVTLVQDVTTTYYAALLSDTQLAFALDDQARTQAAYQDVLARQRAGRALPTDVEAAQLAERNAALALDLARQNIVLSKQNLLATLGLPPGQAVTLRLSDPLASLLSTRADSANWLAVDDAAVARRPEVQQEHLNADLAQASGQTERSGYRPTVGVVGYLGANGYDDGFFRTLDVVNHWCGNSYVALQISLPLLDGSARASRVATQRLRQQQALNRQSDLQQRIGYEVAKACLQLQQAWEVLRVRRANVVLAARSSALVGLRQQAGWALPRERLDAETAQQQAQRDYLQAVYDFLAAHLEYGRATGTLAG